MLRRDFLGTVIGLVAGSPFIASFGPQRSNEFAMAVCTRDGDQFWSPKINQAIEPGKIVFTAAPIDFLQTMTIVGYSIYLPNGRLLKEDKFTSTLPICNGDCIKLAYTISWDNGLKEQINDPNDWQDWSKKYFAHRDRQANQRKQQRFIA